MKTSLKGKIALAVSEGIVDTPYLDSVGVWTIGIGVTKAAGDIDPVQHKGKTFSVPELMKMFEKVLPKYEKPVQTLVKIPLAQHEFDALVHFCYNVGEGGFKKSRLLANLNAGNKKLAFSEGFHGWLKPPELRGRRDKERDMALHGKYGGTVAPLYGVNSSYKPKAKGSVDVAKALNAPVEPVQTTPLNPGVSVPPKDNPSVQPSTGFIEAILSILKALFGKG